MWRKSEDSKLKSSPGAWPSPDPSAQGPRAAMPSDSSAAATTVNHGIRIKGEISGQGNFLVDGEFEGTVHLPDGTFTVGPNARVIAEIEAREIVVRGELIGTLKAHERVHISSTGKLTGDMDTRGIVIEDGAMLHSKVAVPHPQAAALEVPAREAALPEVPAGAVGSPEAVSEASPDALSQNDQPPRPEAPLRTKRAAAGVAAQPNPNEP